MRYEKEKEKEKEKENNRREKREERDVQGQITFVPGRIYHLYRVF
jgi:hypothetical protein